MPHGRGVCCFSDVLLSGGIIQAVRAGEEQADTNAKATSPKRVRKSIRFEWTKGNKPLRNEPFPFVTLAARIISSGSEQHDFVWREYPTTPNTYIHINIVRIQQFHGTPGLQEAGPLRFEEALGGGKQDSKMVVF